jgi:hypothetical protein
MSRIDPLFKIDPIRLQCHLHVLCAEIGVRLGGTRTESAAASYIAREFERVGARVVVEEFAMQIRDVHSEQLEIRIGGCWHRFSCSLFANTPGTEGLWREAPLAFFEAPSEYRRPDLSRLRGKAVVHLGCHIESRAAYRKLIAARPSFLLFVDIRYPGTVPLADGMFPAYTRDLGAVPVVNVAYMDAWRWRTEDAIAARLCVAGGMRPGVSQNVVAELSSSDPNAVLLFLGAHHDTQAGSVGADDNACGVAALLEMARVLEPLRRHRAIRLISFGTEEQLSVGSAEYVRRHRTEVSRRGGLMLNFDGIGAPLGWTELAVNGPAALESTLRRGFAESGFYPRIQNGVVPYADHFPFVAAGVPGVWMARPNCHSGYWYHHRADNDLSRVSPETMAAWLSPATAIVHRLVNVRRLPFPREIPKDQARAVAAHWKDLFGGWRGSLQLRST